MPLKIKKIFDEKCGLCGRPGAVTHVQMTGAPVSADRELTLSQIQAIYREMDSKMQELRELGVDIAPERETRIVNCYPFCAQKPSFDNE